MEVIADKKKSLIILYACLAVVGLSMLAMGITFYHVFSFWDLKGDQQFDILCIIVMGPVITIASTFLCFRVRFTRGKITYDGTYIDFGKGYVIKPSSLINVEYQKAYFTQKPEAWGTLTVYTGDFVIKYKYMKSVEIAYNRIMQLKNEADLSEL